MFYSFTFLYIYSRYLNCMSPPQPSPTLPSGPSCDLFNFMFSLQFVINIVQSMIRFCHCDLISIKNCHGSLP